MSIKRAAFIFAICAAALAPLFHGTPAHAQASRTFVSGSGKDANPCTRIAPCQTFARALALTAANGTINCLDTAGYGGVTITQSVTIDCTGAIGGVLVATANGINVSVANAVVNLRGLAIDGFGGNGLVGINITGSGIQVHIEQCTISGFKTAGISYAPTGTGASPNAVVINDTSVRGNGVGIVLSGAGAAGDIELRDVLVALNTGDAIQVTTGTNHAGAVIDRTTIAFNGGTGLNITSTGTPAGTLVYLGNSTIVGNNVGVANSGGGTFQSFKNNQISGNVTDGTPIPAFPGPPSAPTPLQ